MAIRWRSSPLCGRLKTASIKAGPLEIANAFGSAEAPPNDAPKFARRLHAYLGDRPEFTNTREEIFDGGRYRFRSAVLSPPPSDKRSKPLRFDRDPLFEVGHIPESIGAGIMSEHGWRPTEALEPL